MSPMSPIHYFEIIFGLQGNSNPKSYISQVVLLEPVKWYLQVNLEEMLDYVGGVLHFANFLSWNL